MLAVSQIRSPKIENADGTQNPCVLSTSGLSLSFGGNRVLRDIHLELFAGDVVLLRGENGSGKTTLLNVLTGNLEPDRGEISFLANGQPAHFEFPLSLWWHLNPAGGFTPDAIARQGIGRSWQDTRLFNSLTVMDNLRAAGSRRLGEDPVSPIFMRGRIRAQEAAQEREALTALSRFDLESLGNVGALGLSMGDAKRVAIARSLQAQAKILFLDEPLSSLDDAGVQKAVELLRTMAVKHQITMVLIEHSLHIPLLLDLVNRVWTLRSGILTEQTPADVRDEIRTAASDDASTWIGSLKRDGWSEQVDTLERDALLTRLSHPDRGDASPILELRDWTVRRGLQQVIGPRGVTHVDAGLNLTLKRGEIAILRAPNGWGKTSLAESILGLLPHDSGSAMFDGRPIETLPTWDRSRRGIAFLQSRDNVFVSLTPREMMDLRRSSGMFDLASALRDRQIDQLSGGERQRVALSACLGVPRTSLLILDEPFNMVDASGVARLREHIQSRADLAVLILLPGSVRVH
jgi:ABC-type branched-subunit amino acid transport system ATPase component